MRIILSVIGIAVLYFALIAPVIETYERIGSELAYMTERMK